MPLCNAGNCLALATHGSVCAVHAKYPVTTHTRREQAEFLKIGIDYEFRPEGYPEGDEDDDGWATIATIALDNALSDVVSIQAQAEDGEIELRIRDDAEEEYAWRPKTISQPFTLREMISFIDRARGPCGRGLVFGVLRHNRQGGAEPGELEHFLEVGSEVYPDLARHYRAEMLLWIEGSVNRR